MTELRVQKFGPEEIDQQRYMKEYRCFCLRGIAINRRPNSIVSFSTQNQTRLNDKT